MYLFVLLPPILSSPPISFQIRETLASLLVPVSLLPVTSYRGSDVYEFVKGRVFRAHTRDVVCTEPTR